MYSNKILQRGINSKLELKGKFYRGVAEVVEFSGDDEVCD